MVVNPVTIHPDETLADALRLMAEHRISGIPVVEPAQRPAGRHPHQPRRALRQQPAPAGRRADDHATSWSRCAGNVSRDDAKRLLHQHRIEKLLVVDNDYRCTGLITVKDIEKAQLFPHAAKDEHGRLRVAAAAGTGADGAGARRGAVRRRGRRHGRRHRARPFGAGAGAVDEIRRMSNYTQVVAGNVATADGRAGADRGRRRRGQGRHRPGLDLHDPHGRRGRRAAIHRDRRCRRGMPQGTACR